MLVRYFRFWGLFYKFMLQHLLNFQFELAHGTEPVINEGMYRCIIQ